MPFRFVAYTLPSTGAFTKRFDIPVAMPGSTGQQELSDYADGSLIVPASWSRLDELVSSTTGSLIRVYLGDTVVDEFEAARVSKTIGRPNTRTVSGPQRNGLAEGIALLPKNYPNHSAGAIHWEYGVQNVMPDLSLGSLGTIREQWEVWHDGTGGTWNIDVAGDDVDIDFDATADEVEGSALGAGSGIQGLTTVDDAIVTGEGSEDDPYVITFYAPPIPGTVTFTDNTTGGTTFDATQTEAGRLDPTPITKSKPTDQQGGEEADFGGYDYPAIEVETSSPLNGDSDYSIKVNATSGVPGSQVIVDVVPGQVYSEIAVPVYPESNGNYLIVIRDIYGNLIAEDRVNALTADTWTDLTIESFVAPAGVDQVVLRIATSDPDTHYVDWQGATMLTGEPEATFTEIVDAILSAAQDRGVADWLELDADATQDTAGTSLSEISFTAFVGDNANLVNAVLDEGKKLGYQWRIVTADEAAIVSPGVDTTHVLQIFETDTGEIEDLTASAGAPSVLAGAAGVTEGAVQERRLPYTKLIGLGSGSVSTEVSDATAEANIGTIERVVDLEGLGTVAAIDKALDSSFAAQSQNRKAATAEITERAEQVPLVNYGTGSKIWWQFPGILAKVAQPVQKVSWTHGNIATFEVSYGSSLSGDAAIAKAVDQYLRRPGRRTTASPATPSSGLGLGGGGGGDTGSHVHCVATGGQWIDEGGDAILWTAYGQIARVAIDGITFPESQIVIRQPGYYDVGVMLEWDTFDGGGSVWIERTRGGDMAQVWPQTGGANTWEATDGQTFEGVAKAIPCEAGDILEVVVDHQEGSGYEELASASVAVELVESYTNSTAIEAFGSAGVIDEIRSYRMDTASQDLEVAFTSAQQTGDAIFILLVSGSNQFDTGTYPSGWTALIDNVLWGNSNGYYTLLWKESDGTNESNFTVSVQTGNDEIAAGVWVIRSSRDYSVTPPTVGTPNKTQTPTIDPLGVTGLSGNYLVHAIVVRNGGERTATPPSGYTLSSVLEFSTPAGADDHPGLEVMRRSVFTTSGEDPGVVDYGGSWTATRLGSVTLAVPV